MARLIVQKGEGRGEVHEVFPDGTLLGRDADCDVHLTDPRSSRQHLRLFEKDGAWWAQDLGSANGTFLNAKRFEGTVSLSSGDRIRIGSTVLQFEAGVAEPRLSSGPRLPRIEGFELLNPVGRGTTGTVYRARQVNLGRDVAVKVLSRHLARDVRFVERFHAEAKAAAQLTHGNVVPIYDVGESDGLHYFTMAYMPGGSVEELLASMPGSRIPWRTAVPMIIDAARGLAYAEKRGFIHRDVKPGNLMLDNENRVQLGDLGIAKRADEVQGRGIVGTPHYMAPEQARGERVSHLADIYSLGATAYRVLGGKTPFEGDDALAIVRQQATRRPNPLEWLAPDVPLDLVAIVTRMMAQEPQDRFPSAERVVEALEQFLVDRDVQKATRTIRSRRTFAGLGVLMSWLVLLLLAGALGWGLAHFAQIRDWVQERRGRAAAPAEAPPDAPRPPREVVEVLASREAELGEVSLERSADWLGIAQEYEALASSHPVTDPTVADAVRRAGAIRARLDALEAEQKGR